MLVIQNELRNNETRFEKLQEILKEENFYIKEIDKNDLNFNGTIKIVAINQNKLKKESKERKNNKLKDIFEVLKQNKEIFSNKNSILILDINSEIIKNSLKKIGQITHNIQSKGSVHKLLDLSENQFEGAIIANFLEYINFQEYNIIFKELKRILKPNADILILVPDKTNYFSKFTAHLFDKGILLRILDENNISVQAISLNSSFKMLQTLLKNQASFPIEKNNVKVLLLGIYSMRYTFLSNARWDSQARAFEKLGFQTKIIDLEDEFYGYVINVIKNYKPDILWVGGKDGGAFLNANANFFKEHKYKVVYWLWDIITPKYF
ncbi:MAG TPA: class I SAM-dependent methyltransferase, partial [Candidatus Lokiarchaeia archaeon]